MVRLIVHVFVSERKKNSPLLHENNLSYTNISAWEASALTHPLHFLQCLSLRAAIFYFTSHFLFHSASTNIFRLKNNTHTKTAQYFLPGYIFKLVVLLFYILLLIYCQKNTLNIRYSEWIKINQVFLSLFFLYLYKFEWMHWMQLKLDI